MIDKEKQRLNVSAKLGIALAVVMCLLIAWGVMLVRDKLLLNADEMGTSLAASYATEEENRFTVYQLFMGLGATYINDMIDQGADEERIVRWMQSFTDNTARVLGDDLIEPYAVIDGRILAAVPWEGDEGYDYADTDWYRGAFTTDNGVYFADAYEDAITGEPVITISLKLHGEGNVLAFDIRLDKFNDYESDTTMPEGSSYFLFDSNGELIYSIVSRDVTSAGMQSYSSSCAPTSPRVRSRTTPRASSTSRVRGAACTTPPWTTAGSPSSPCPLRTSCKPAGTKRSSRSPPCSPCCSA